MRLLDILPDNVERLGFFCQMSRRKYPGWQRKLAWVRDRLKEGMRIKLLGQGERGFIEYIPGQFAWRPVEARGFMVIHCLWVVGKSKGKGYGNRLVEACLADARRAGMSGVAMVTSEGNWLAGSALLSKNGFEAVDRVEPSFALMVHRFRGTRAPRFTGRWSEKARRFGRGLTVIRSDQCPYNEDAVENLLAAAGEQGITSRVVELNSAGDIRARSPSPYGTFGIVLDGSLVGYHYLLRKDGDQLLKSGR